MIVMIVMIMIVMIVVMMMVMMVVEIIIIMKKRRIYLGLQVQNRTILKMLNYLKRQGVLLAHIHQNIKKKQHHFILIHNRNMEL